MQTYTPQPIDTTKIEVPKDLLELAEIMARNVHENWALERIHQGWKFGNERNDVSKLHPCLVPFENLPEEEKTYDYNTAMETIKVIIGLGYEITRKH